MKVKDLLKQIFKLLYKKRLDFDSKVTIHVYVDDGVAVEWSGSDIMIECHGPNGDGLEINVDSEGRGIRYED